MKKIVSLALAAMMITSCFSACSSSSSSSQGGASSSALQAAGTASTAVSAANGQKVKIGYVCMNLGNPWFVSVKKGFDAACKELGAEGMVIDSQYKVDKQVSDLESLINDNYNAILLSPIDQKATAKLIDTANSKKIATACVAQSQDNCNFRYIVDEYQYGVMIGTGASQWINSALSGKAKVAIISQDNVKATIARGNGVEETITANNIFLLFKAITKAITDFIICIAIEIIRVKISVFLDQSFTFYFNNCH